MTRDSWLYVALGAVAAVGAWVLFVGLPRWYPPDTPPTATGATPGTPTDGELVDATLFYISDDGMWLIESEQRLERHTEPAALLSPTPPGTRFLALYLQALVILEAQLAEPPTPLLSPIPPGTRLLALYLLERGDAIVDLSEEVVFGHSGGSLEELFTVYAIVNALTTNLPAINAVQILINGREVDTLVGHVDLQRPLERNMQWVADPEAEPPLEAEAASRPTI